VKSFNLNSEAIEAKHFIFKNFHVVKNKPDENEQEKRRISAFLKILEKGTNNILINENISINEKSACINQINILDENENLPEVIDNITMENILKIDFKKYLNFNANFNHENKLVSVENQLQNFEDFDYSLRNRFDFLGKKRKSSDALNNEEIPDKDSKYKKLIMW
jgi:hypothetical protein